MADLNTGGPISDFTVVARIFKFGLPARKCPVLFSASHLDGEKSHFDPRFFELERQNEQIQHQMIKINRAWVNLFGIFIFAYHPYSKRNRVYFVSSLSAGHARLLMVLRCMRTQAECDQRSLSSLLWRMNVLR